MRQMYPCPRCGVPVDYGSRFCGNCGNTLQPPTPPPPPSPYGYQYPQQPQPSGQQQRPPYPQQPGWNQPPPSSQAPGQGGPNPYQQQNTYGHPRAMPQKKNSSNTIVLLIALIVIIFTIGGIALATKGTFSFSSSSKPTGNVPAPTTPTTPAETPPSSTPAAPEPAPPQTPAWPTSSATPITAAEIIGAYTNDMVSAGAKYEGNTYAISGIASSVDSGTPPFVYLKGATTDTVEIQCSFSQGQEANVSSLNVGQSVKIEAKIGKFQNRIITSNYCRIVQ